jgi:hypothetical protein
MQSAEGDDKESKLTVIKNVVCKVLYDFDGGGQDMALPVTKGQYVEVVLPSSLDDDWLEATQCERSGCFITDKRGVGSASARVTFIGVLYTLRTQTSLYKYEL